MFRSPFSSSFSDRRPTGQRLSFGLWIFLIASFAIFMLSRADHPWVSVARAEITSTFAPAMAVLDMPFDAYDSVSLWASELLDVRDENRRLKQEVGELRQWQSEAERLARQNADLEDVLNAETGAAETLATVRVISATGGPFVRSILVDGGRDIGITPDLAVVDESGLVGRTVLVGRSASRVLLVTDLNSRIPVRIERTNQDGIVLGRNDDRLDLDFLPLDADLIVGDLVLTSGDGGIFPPDLKVGTVTQVDGATAVVEPLAGFAAIDFVRVLDFDTSALEPSEELISANEDEAGAEEAAAQVDPPQDVAEDGGDVVTADDGGAR